MTVLLELLRLTNLLLSLRKAYTFAKEWWAKRKAAAKP